MVEDSELLWMDDIVVQKKRKTHQRKSNKEIEIINFIDENNKFKAFDKLFEIDIPKSAQTLLSKLITIGQLTSVNKVLFRKKKSIILSGKANKTHRSFPLLSSDDVIIKILINGNKNELWKRAYDEYHQNVEEGNNRPIFLLQTGNILITSMIGDGEPAPTLRNVLNSNQTNIAVIYNQSYSFGVK